MLCKQLMGLTCEGKDFILINKNGKKYERGGVHLRFKYWKKRLSFPDSITFTKIHNINCGL